MRDAELNGRLKAADFKNVILQSPKQLSGT